MNTIANIVAALRAHNGMALDMHDQTSQREIKIEAVALFGEDAVVAMPADVPYYSINGLFIDKNGRACLSTFSWAVMDPQIIQDTPEASAAEFNKPEHHTPGLKYHQLSQVTLVKEEQKMNYVKDSVAFAKHFDAAKAIPFDPAWEESCGYFGGALYEDGPVLLAGEIVKSVDDHGRKILMIGTQLGNAVVFQRYSNNEEVFVKNFPTQLNWFSQFAVGAQVHPDAMDWIFGTAEEGNISQKLAALPAEEYQAYVEKQESYLARRRKAIAAADADQ